MSGKTAQCVRLCNTRGFSDIHTTTSRSENVAMMPQSKETKTNGSCFFHFSCDFFCVSFPSCRLTATAKSMNLVRAGATCSSGLFSWELLLGEYLRYIQRFVLFLKQSSEFSFLARKKCFFGGFFSIKEKM